MQYELLQHCHYTFPITQFQHTEELHISRLILVEDEVNAHKCEKWYHGTLARMCQSGVYDATALITLKKDALQSGLHVMTAVWVIF